MPQEVVDNESGAILIKKTDEEKLVEKIDMDVRVLSHQVSYLFAFAKRYEPVFEKMLGDLNKE